jgi:beta-lactamase class D
MHRAGVNQHPLMHHLGKTCNEIRWDETQLSIGWILGWFRRILKIILLIPL